MSHHDEQLSFLNEQSAADNTPVVCLGMTFENDEARRDYFREELRKKLPELKNIEGFPIGEDENIIALSDPPYYTACPNPWINELVDSNENRQLKKVGPYASDVSIGKSGMIYNAHSYHTKVPHKAIMKYILHYTNPGDTIIDVFSGTGMTGVAGYMCGNEKEIASMGFIIDKDDTIHSDEGSYKLGERKVILNDLSPTAALISSNYNSSIDKEKFTIEADRLINDISLHVDKLFKTKDILNGKEIEGEVNYAVWSDDFICSECGISFNFFDIAVDKDIKKVKDEFNCPSCNALLTKRKIQPLLLKEYDPILDDIIEKVSQKLVLINYTYNGKRYDKVPDEYDLNLIKEIENIDWPYEIKTDRMVDGDESRRNDKIGLTHTHHFFSKRNLLTISLILDKVKSSEFKSLFLGILRSSLSYSTKMVKVNISRLLTDGGLFSFGSVTGTLYVPSVNGERPITAAFRSKLKSVMKTIPQSNNSIITNQSSIDLSNINSESIDYIFIDPPFGSNLMYSELNFIWESFMGVYTDNKTEAIVNNTQKKSLFEYETLMNGALNELYRLLKPERWITIEFSNSQASIWNSIQNALQKAGFIIANVAALDKKQGSFKAVTSMTAVKQDLVISAYKPSKEYITAIREQTNTPESAWSFVTQYLEQLVIFSGIKGEASVIPERTPRILFDRMVAYHVQNNLPVPISSAEFQSGVAQRFPMRDGMAFLESQVAEYDKKRILVKEFSQMNLFVSDENSAIEWIRQQLMKKPQTRQDLHPQFMKEIQHIAKHEQLPELDSLLLQNFLRYEGDEVVPDQIGSYLRRNYHDFRGLENDDEKMKDKALNRWYVPDPNKQADLEKLREKSLLREFESYIEELGTHKKKLRQFRTEAIRAGFKKAWSDKDYAKIVTVGDRLPESVIQEDDKLLMYYDNAQIRLDM
ncbi:DNA methyltransferase [Sporosarcina highlanderae]|uniref:DNA methyltransferase n=1 Tax=Sporosarcina highlanderae TaxID=3035916 RepID=A0ABT8JSQ9_9BACL|nr:DNA methyltransferase [Sporosarcina highlanderae]MDN4608201.1 DNA methyltransferase [Sporosarcina highlanderae]